jgi:hypothetical protein
MMANLPSRKGGRRLRALPIEELPVSALPGIAAPLRNRIPGAVRK